MTSPSVTSLRSLKRALLIGLITVPAYLVTSGLWILLQAWRGGETLQFADMWGPDFGQRFWGLGLLLVLLIFFWGSFVFSIFKDDRYYSAGARPAWVVFGIVMTLAVIAIQQIVPAAWLERPIRFFTNLVSGPIAAYVGYLVAFKMLYRAN
jgi:hypothetical protein